MALEGSKVLPFSPTLLIGFSAGGFGGGSNLVSPVFGSMSGRTDTDVIALLDAPEYWGRQRRPDQRGEGSTREPVQYQQVAVLNQVRAEIAIAYARTHARYAQIGTYRGRCTCPARSGFREDYELTIEQTGRRVLPIELLNNFRLLNTARREYLDAIVDYNKAQFELYVALGQPPADCLARPVPVGGPGAVGPAGDQAGPHASRSRPVAGAAHDWSQSREFSSLRPEPETKRRFGMSRRPRVGRKRPAASLALTLAALSGCATRTTSVRPAVPDAPDLLNVSAVAPTINAGPFIASVSPLRPGEGPGARGVAPPMARNEGPSDHHSTGDDPHPGPLPGGEGGRSPADEGGLTSAAETPPSIPQSAAPFPIDLTAALRLAENQNPVIGEARTLILGALAERQAARALLFHT